jgi:uncharacterized protein
MAANPFLLNVADLLSRDGSSRTETVEAPVEWALELTRIRPDPPLRAELTLHPVTNGIAVTGTVEFTTEDSCTRCLRSTLTERSVTVGALFDRSGDEEETYALVGHEIDVEQLLRDETLLSLPIAPLCGDDCPGLVTTPKTDLNTDPSDPDGDARSPFAVLKDLLDSED